VPWDLPQLEAARQAGVPVIAEIELAYRHLQGGSRRSPHQGEDHDHRGARRHARAAGFDARVGATSAAVVGLVRARRGQVFAVEVSSFQLGGIDALPPQLRSG